MTTKVWRYEGPNRQPSGEVWFIAFVDEKGCVAVLSDYGNYSYCWGSPGSDMRHALLRFGPGYIADKFGYNVKSEIDGEATSRGIKDHILDMRRQGSMEKEEAREEWEYASRDFDTDVDFHVWMNDTGIGDSYEFYRSKKPRLRAFMEKVWPCVVAAIAADLAGETISG